MRGECIMLNKVIENLKTDKMVINTKIKEGETGIIADFPGVKLVALVNDNGFAPDFNYLFFSKEIASHINSTVKELLAKEPEKTSNGKTIWKTENMAIVPVNDKRLYVEINADFIRAKIFVDKDKIDQVIATDRPLGFKRHNGDLMFDCGFERKSVKLGNVVWDKNEKKYKTVYDDEGKYVTLPLSGTAEGMAKASRGMIVLEKLLEKAKEITSVPQVDSSMYEYAE